MYNPFKRKEQLGIEKKSYALEELLRASANSGGATKRSTPVSDNYESYAKNAYLNTATVYYCISLIAQKATTIPVKLFTKEDDNNERTEIKSHPILNLLEKPSASVDYFEWLERLITFYLLGGNAIQEPNVLDGVVKELNTYNPKDVEYEVAGNEKLISYKVMDEDNQERSFVVNQVTKSSGLLHWKNIDPLVDYKGSSALSSSRTSIDIHNTGDSHNYNMLKNQARPSGAFSYKPGDGQPMVLEDEAFERLKQEIDQKMTGDANAGKPLLLEGGLEWIQMSLNARDLDYINSRHTTMKDICRSLKVPPSLLGIEGDSSYNNMRESKELLWENAILPMMRRLLSHLNQNLLPLFKESGGLELAMDLSLIPDLSIKQERIWDRIRQADHITINEKRKMTGYEPLEEGGDTVIISSGDMPYNLLLQGVTAGNLNEIANVGGTTNDSDANNESIVKSKKNYIYKASSLSNEDYLAKLDKLTVGIEDEFKEELDKLFEEFGNQLEEGYNKGGELAIAIIILFMQDRLTNVYKPKLKRAVEIFSNFVLADIQDVIVNEGDYDRRINTFIEQELFKRAEFVKDTTDKIVKKTINDGREQELSEEEVARNIGQDVKDEKRTRMIASNEVIGSREFGMFTAVEFANRSYHKQWVTAGDEIVRTDHASVNGETIPMEASFDVGGEAMDHPKDSGASAKNTVNCRCSVRYIPSSEIS